MKSETKQQEKDKKMLSFFLLLFPTILVGVVGALIPNYGSMLIIILLVLYQAVLLKQFVDNYYGVLE